MKRKSASIDEFLGFKRAVEWTRDGSVLVGKCNLSESPETNKVAAFDFDHTIAVNIENHVFPKNGNDWKWFCPSVPTILVELFRLGYFLVIVSNQLNIDKADKRMQAFKGRIERTCKELQSAAKSAGIECISVLILAATRDDEFRKPRPGIWNLLQSMYPTLKFVKSSSFYCGDAAGRKEIAAKASRKDHTDTDRKWALNVGLPFYVPQQLFDESLIEKYSLEAKLHVFAQNPLPKIEFDPGTYNIGSNQRTSKFAFGHDVIIFVGSPASGKTTFCKKYFGDYYYVNQDTLKTLPKCLKAVSDALDSGKKVVVDNTNSSMEVRRKYVEIAKQRNKDVICLWFNTSWELSNHNNLYRSFANSLKALCSTGKVDPEAKAVPDIALTTYWKNFQTPTAEEGFEVEEIEFSPSFNDPEDERYWRLHYS